MHIFPKICKATKINNSERVSSSDFTSDQIQDVGSCHFKIQFTGDNLVTTAVLHILAHNLIKKSIPETVLSSDFPSDRNRDGSGHDFKFYFTAIFRSLLHLFAKIWHRD